MQRKLLIVMMLTAVLAGEGCRRGGEKKAPVLVTEESDFLYTGKGDVIGSGLAPKAKLTPEERKAQEEQKEKDKKNQEDLAKAKREKDTKALADFLRSYRQANPVATLYSYEKVRLALRRQKLTDLYHDVDSNIMVPYLVDDLNPAHILAYHKTVESQIDPATQKTVELGNPAVFADGRFAFVKAADLVLSLKHQDLLVGWYYYVKFATPYFYRTSAEFGPYVPSPAMGPPPVFLGKIRARSPDLLKNPADERTFDRFKKYLNENAPPYLSKLVADNTLCVSMTADLHKPAELVICRVASEGKDNGKDKGHMAINAGAQIAVYDPEPMKLWIAQNQPKK